MPAATTGSIPCHSTTREKVDPFSINGDLFIELNDKGTLYYGVEGIYNKVSSESYLTDISTGAVSDSVPSRYPDAGSHYGTVAAYTQYRHRFSDILTSQLGACYSFVAISSTFDKNRDLLNLPYETAELYTGAFSGSGGVAFEPGRDWKLQSPFLCFEKYYFTSTPLSERRSLSGAETKS